MLGNSGEVIAFTEMLESLKLFLTVMLGSGASIAIAKLIFDIRREKRDRSDAVKYLAIQLAFQFEGFTIDCASGASDHRTAIEHEGHAGAYLGNVPTPPALPSSDAYRFLDADVLNRVFGFAQLCKMAQLAAGFWVDVVGDNECYQVAVEEGAISMGSEALEIARAVRVKYSLGSRALEFGKWNIDDFIRKETAKLTKRIERRDKMEREVDARKSK